MYRWNRMPLYTDEWIEFKWRILEWLEYFWQYKNLKNSTNKKVKKLQKLIKEVRKKKSKTEKNKGCTYMSRSIECAHRKYEKVNGHKK